MHSSSFIIQVSANTIVLVLYYAHKCDTYLGDICVEGVLQEEDLLYKGQILNIFYDASAKHVRAIYPTSFTGDNNKRKTRNGNQRS